MVHRATRGRAQTKPAVRSGFRILEHPADLGIEGWGRTLARAYEACARGLISIFIDPLSIESGEERRISISAMDPDQLLVKWLEEILYLYDGEGFVARKATIKKLTPTNLEAVLTGESFDPGKHRSRLDVKAITYHQLLIRKAAEGFVARVYVDI